MRTIALMTMAIAFGSLGCDEGTDKTGPSDVARLGETEEQAFAGPITAPAFSGAHEGDGSALVSVDAATLAGDSDYARLGDASQQSFTGALVAASFDGNHVGDGAGLTGVDADSLGGFADYARLGDPLTQDFAGAITAGAFIGDGSGVTGVDAAQLGGLSASGFAPAAHNHDASYAAVAHNHDLSYAAVAHAHDFGDINNVPALAAEVHTHSFADLDDTLQDGQLSGTYSDAVTLTDVTFGCETGFTPAVGGRLCISALQSPLQGNAAVSLCRGLAGGARVCSYADIQQACGSGAIAATGSTTGWVGDWGGSNDTLATWDTNTCNTNMDGSPASAFGGGPTLTFRCCY